MPKCTLTWRSIEAKFESFEEFEREFDLSSINRKRTRDTNKGRKITFFCKKKECQYKLLVTLGDLVSLSESGSHSCRSSETDFTNTDGRIKLPKTTLESLLNLNEGFTATELKNSLGEEYFHLKLEQIENFKQRLRKKANSPGNLSYQELVEWSNLRSEISDCPNKTIVIKKWFSEEKFRIALSTKTLFENAKNAKCLHVDATYKLVIGNFPLLVAGITDRNKRFHPLVLAFCYSETKDDYLFLLQSIKEGFAKFNIESPIFEFFVADAAQAISSAFVSIKETSNIFKETCKRGVCWAHVIRAIDSKIESLANNDFSLKSDIRICQLAICEQEFYNAIALLKNKHANYSVFLKYFQDNWIDKNMNWYEGCSLLFPSTNNALECYNKFLKEKGVRMKANQSISFFLSVLEKMIRSNSLERSNNGTKLYSNSIDISTANWVEAVVFLNSFIAPPRLSMYFFSVESNTFLNSLPLISAFDDWKYLKEKLVVIVEIENLFHACSCKQFIKNYHCRHSLSFDILRGSRSTSYLSSALPITGRLKRGRPKKISAALHRN